MISDTIREIEKEIARLREDNRLYREKANDEFWTWQGDGDDHLESLTCPVLIPAVSLRSIMAANERLRKSLTEANKKWRLYEEEYILPCFGIAKACEIDLEELVMTNPGTNCVILLVRELQRRGKS